MNSRLKFGETFCVLPWIEKHIDLGNKRKLCCHSKLECNSKDLKVLRNEIWKGNKIAHCDYCYNLENQKVISPRQIESNRWLDKDQISSYFETDKCPNEKIVFYDLRVDNKCNLSCISCNPKNSSLWAQELQIPINKYKIEININELINLEKIYIAGGEPLVIDEYIDILSILAEKNPNIEVVINTNLSVLPSKFLKSLKNLKNLSFIVSLDAYGKVNEYHRYPLNWDKFFSNLITIQNLNFPINFNTVVDAVSIFGLGKLNILQNIPITWNLVVLKEPNWLELKNIPNHLKSIALENLSEFKNNNKFFKKDISFRTRCELIEAEIWQNGNCEILIDSITKLDMRRNIQHRNYLDFSFIQ